MRIEGVFTKGMRVQTTQLGMERLYSGELRTGVVQNNPRYPRSAVKVLVDGRTTLSYFHPHFWEEERLEQGPRIIHQEAQTAEFLNPDNKLLKGRIAALEKQLQEAREEISFLRNNR